MKVGSTDYSKWDDLYDSDEERKKGKLAEERKKKAAHAAAMQSRSKAPAASTPAMPAGMTEQDFAEQYQKMFNGGKQRQPYKFPETMEEQRAKCNEAADLKRRGNEFYQKGELVEAAKLYEQAVMKFADWYAVTFATDEEKEMVHAVKLPCHNNLATCSFKLGNHQHAVIHCGQVLDHDADNIKALYRRGACHLRLGNLDGARVDLQRASKLAPNDVEVRAELKRLQEKLGEYKAKNREMSGRMLAGADGGLVDEPATGAAADDEAPPDDEDAEGGASGDGDDEGDGDGDGDGDSDGGGGGGDDDEPPPPMHEQQRLEPQGERKAPTKEEVERALEERLRVLEEQLKVARASEAAAKARAGKLLWPGVAVAAGVAVLSIAARTYLY